MKYISVSEVAQRLGNHEKTVRRYINNGQLQARKIGGQWKIAESWLEDFSRCHEDNPTLHLHHDDFCIYMDSDYFESREDMQSCCILDIKDPNAEEQLLRLKSVAFDEVMQGARVKIETMRKEGFLRIVLWCVPEVLQRLLGAFE